MKISADLIAARRALLLGEINAPGSSASIRVSLYSGAMPSSVEGASQSPTNRIVTINYPGDASLFGADGILLANPPTAIVAQNGTVGYGLLLNRADEAVGLLTVGLTSSNADLKLGTLTLASGDEIDSAELIITEVYG